MVSTTAPQKAQMWFSNSGKKHVGSNVGRIPPLKTPHQSRKRAMQQRYLGIAHTPTVHVRQKHKKNTLFQQMSNGVQLKAKEEMLFRGGFQRWAKPEVTL